MSEELASPRLDELSRDIASGHADALAVFWRSVEHRGTPLVEAAPSQGERLVTFLWRDRVRQTRSVRIFRGPITGLWPFSEPMQRLLETDLWYLTFRVPSDMRATYSLILNKEIPDRASVSVQEARACYYAGRPDPLNPTVQVIPAVDSDPDSRESRLSVLELPDVSPQPWFAERPGVPRGTLEELTVMSAALREERRAWVYTPAYRASRATPSNLVVLTDGQWWTSGHPLTSTFDNLIACGEISPTAVVMVDSLDALTRSRDLTGSKPFLAFLTNDLLPLVRSRWNVTDSPGRTAIAGQSFGGLTALYAGLERSDVFGNVLSQAGAFQAHTGSPEWLPDAFARAPKLPLRFYLDVGIFDEDSIIECNRRLRDVLNAKGYELTYAEFSGGHDYFCWRGTIADGLIALFGGFANSGAE